ncbi:uncharacterized protein LOC128471928 [Spea bombifrons]|uniref:uncharacterized protein LOC128471928 n=1 Tax=Spea bombifrons TaxID=233779 RepID=UPI00234ACA77|nr:uncharacterized protein LOC128471928 [Spea bombifrons]
MLSSLCLLCFFSLATGTCFQEKYKGGINQYPKRILVQPGRSATIFCNATTKDPITGVHLKKRFTKIMYINKNKVNFYGNHLNLSGSVGDFSVTLHNLTEDDTDIYYCDGETVAEEDICGEGTILIVAPKTGKCQDGIMQYPKTILVQSGKLATLRCSITSQEKITRVHLLKRHSSIMNIDNFNKVDIRSDFQTNLVLSGTYLDFNVTLNNLTLNDTDLYSCKGEIKAKEDICSEGTMITVIANNGANNCEVEIAIVFFTAILLALTTYSVFAMVKCYKKRGEIQSARLPQNTVYEDMTQTIRRNTMGHSTSTSY